MSSILSPHSSLSKTNVLICVSILFWNRGKRTQQTDLVEHDRTVGIVRTMHWFEVAVRFMCTVQSKMDFAHDKQPHKHIMITWWPSVFCTSVRHLATSPSRYYEYQDFDRYTEVWLEIARYPWAAVVRRWVDGAAASAFSQNSLFYLSRQPCQFLHNHWAQLPVLTVPDTHSST